MDKHSSLHVLIVFASFSEPFYLLSLFFSDSNLGGNLSGQWVVSWQREVGWGCKSYLLSLFFSHSDLGENLSGQWVVFWQREVGWGCKSHIHRAFCQNRIHLGHSWLWWIPLLQFFEEWTGCRQNYLELAWSAWQKSSYFISYLSIRINLCIPDSWASSHD